jgi:branched-chain amino acid transport system substrate-binding protein
MTFEEGPVTIRRTLSAFALIFALAIVAAGCGDDDKESSASSGGGASTEKSADTSPILIGMPIAKTGGFSTYDLGVQQGVKAAVAKINADGGLLGGRKLEVKDFDTASKLDNSGPGAKQLLSQGAKFIIGTSDYDFGGPASREASRQGVFTMGLAGDTKFGFHGIGPTAFNIFPGSPVTGATTAEFAYKKGWRKAYTLTDTINSYPATVTKWFTDRFNQQDGAKVIGKDLFLNSDASVATQIARIKAARPDVLLLSSFPPGGASALKQIRAAGIDIPVIGDIGFDGRYWYGSVPKLSNFFGPRPVSQFGDSDNPDVNAFFATLKEQTGKDSLLGSYPAAGYSMVQVFAKAVTDAGTTDGEKVADAVRKLKDFPTLFGKLDYSWKPDCNLPAPLPTPYYEVTKGKEKIVDTITPESVPAYAC